jgi:hypothetical protein
MADIEHLGARRQRRRMQRRDQRQPKHASTFNKIMMTHHNKSTKSSRANAVTMPNLDRYHVRAIPFVMHKVHPPACRASKYLDPYSINGCCNPGMKYPFKDERPKSARKMLDIENAVNIATQKQVSNLGITKASMCAHMLPPSVHSNPQLGSLRERASGIGLKSNRSSPTASPAQRKRAWEGMASTAPF